jgi:hypothetical protein
MDSLRKIRGTREANRNLQARRHPITSLHMYFSDKTRRGNSRLDELCRRTISSLEDADAMLKRSTFDAMSVVVDVRWKVI